MAKITEVTIINSSTIRIDVDAKKGDEINLLEIAKVDYSYLQNVIEQEEEKQIKKRLDELKKQLELEKNNQIMNATSKLEQEKIVLTTKLENIKNEVETQIKLQYLEKINNLEKELEIAKTNLINEQNKQENIIKEINLKNQIENANQIANIKEEYLDQIQKKDQIINDLRLTKSVQNVKKIGEELENWCNMEYENYAQCGFETCTWEKDNLSIKNEDETKGTKADYIFKVYASTQFLPEQLLTSVACEMKNEAPNSTNKKKNSDHYNKLDKDRIKKQCEYALLISELEWDQPNDLPIKKVKEYEKMYVVRPQYFITFLSIVTSMSKKFEHLILETIKEQEKFKDANLIKEEFEKFKNDLLDKPLTKMEKELTSMIDNANKIKDCSNKIIDSANSLISKTLKDIETKINNFKIEKIIKKINKLED